MSGLRQKLKSEFSDEDYRYAYAESFLNTKIATQIKTLREQRGKKQSELGVVTGTKQSGFSRFEDVNHSVWKTDTLWKIARALGVRVNISFETFGSLIEEKEHFSKKVLERPDFKDDPDFMSQPNPDTLPKRKPRKKTNPPPRECGTRSVDSGSMGYTCDLEAGHKGPHRCMDKDDCPHYYERKPDAPR